MKTQRLVGVILIIAGGLLLAHQMNWFELNGQHLIGMLSILIGLSFFKKALQNPQKQGVFGGTFFVLFGLTLLIIDVSHGPFSRALLIGLLFMALAVANLVYFVATNWQRNLNLFMFFFFGAIGGSILLVYYNVIDVWQFEYLATTYWPLVLIVLGFLILIDSIIQKKKRLKEDQAEVLSEKRQDETN